MREQSRAPCAAKQRINSIVDPIGRTKRKEICIMTNQYLALPLGLIPQQSFHGIHPLTKDDLVFLGKNNLGTILRHYEREKRAIEDQLKKTMDQHAELDGKTPTDIKKMAATYDRPSELPKLPQRKDKDGRPVVDKRGQPKPFDDASINRQADATTYNFCGWCKHCVPTGDARIRHNCRIDATCSLIPKEFGGGNAIHGHDRLLYNTPCIIANGPQYLLKMCTAHLLYKIKELTEEKRKIRSYMKFICDALEQAEEKPYFPGHRPADHFKLGDAVFFFVDESNTGLISGFAREPGFASGEIFGGGKNGYDVIVRSEKFTNGDVCCKLSCSQLLTEWEYDYLKKHPEYLEIWLLSASGDLRNCGCGEEMIEAFSE